MSFLVQASRARSHEKAALLRIQREYQFNEGFSTILHLYVSRKYYKLSDEYECLAFETIQKYLDLGYFYPTYNITSSLPHLADTKLRYSYFSQLNNLCVH
jgi:hypothetical protein